MVCAETWLAWSKARLEADRELADIRRRIEKSRALRNDLEGALGVKTYSQVAYLAEEK